MKKLINKKIIIVSTILLGLGLISGIIFFFLTSSLDKMIVKNEILEYTSLSATSITLSSCLNSLKWRPFYGKKEIQRTKDMMELLKITNLSTKSFSELSGGQQQRVAIARAIVNNPKILICDEPTGNLDPVISMEIMEILDKINKDLGTTILMVTHDHEIVNKMKKRVLVLKDGRLVKDYKEGEYKDEVF